MEILTDPVFGVTATPQGPKLPTPIEYALGDVPMRLTSVQLSGGAELVINDSHVLTSATLDVQVSQSAKLVFAAPACLHSANVCVESRGCVHVKGSVVITGMLRVSGDASAVCVDNFCVDNCVVASGPLPVGAVSVTCTVWTDVRCAPGVIRATSLLQRVVPQMPTRLYQGPCQFCQEVGGTLAGACGHVFVCDQCAFEHGLARIYNSPCPLCRSTVATLISVVKQCHPTTTRCAS